jgi:hypothetical protein
VAVNRGLPITVFATVSAAKNWLLRNDHTGAESHHLEETDTPHP